MVAEGNLLAKLAVNAPVVYRPSLNIVNFHEYYSLTALLSWSHLADPRLTTGTHTAQLVTWRTGQPQRWESVQHLALR